MQSSNSLSKKVTAKISRPITKTHDLSSTNKANDCSLKIFLATVVSAMASQSPAQDQDIPFATLKLQTFRSCKVLMNQNGIS
jgi:hypothetical protein